MAIRLGTRVVTPHHGEGRVVRVFTSSYGTPMVDVEVRGYYAPLRMPGSPASSKPPTTTVRVQASRVKPVERDYESMREQAEAEARAERGLPYDGLGGFVAGMFGAAESWVGRSWESREGTRKVIDVHPVTGDYLVQGPPDARGRPGTTYFIPPDKIERERMVDESWAASARRQRVAEAEAAAREAEARAGFAASPLGRYLALLTPFQAGKIKATLDQPLNYHGLITTRAGLIEQLVREGRTLGNEDGSPTLEAPDGRYIGVKVLTKSGMDYAAWLLDQKPSGLGGFVAGMFGNADPRIATFDALTKGDRVRLRVAGENKWREVTITGTDTFATGTRVAYTTSGRVRPGHFRGGVIELRQGTLSFQPTMQQQVQRVAELERIGMVNGLGRWR